MLQRDPHQFSMFISELSKVNLFLSKSQRRNMGRIYSFNGKDKSILCVHEKVPIRRADYWLCFSFTLCSVCYKVSHVDIALSYRFIVSPIVFSNGLWHYIESQAQNDHSCASNKGQVVASLRLKPKCPETSNPKHGVEKDPDEEGVVWSQEYRFKIFRFKVNQQARGLIIVSASLFLCSSFPSSLNTFTRLTFCLLPKYLHTVSFPHSSG